MAKRNSATGDAPSVDGLPASKGQSVCLAAKGQTADVGVFRALAEHSCEFIGICDPQFNIFYINKAGRRLVGLDSFEEACTTKVQDYFFPEDERYLREEFFPKVLREGAAEVEIRFRHFKTGAALWVIYNVFQLTEAEGRVSGYAAVSRDITERKRTEAALRESEEFFRLMFTESIVGKAQADPATGRFVRVNGALCRMTGYSEEELLGRTFHDITHPEEREADRERFRKLVNGETGSYTCEKRYVRRDGGIVWAEVAVNLVRDAAGRPTRSFAVIQDVTARKRAEEKVRMHQGLLETVINSLPMQVSLIRGSDLRLEFINAPYQALAPGKQMVGRTLDEIWPETGQDFARLCRRVLETGEVYQVEDELNMIRRSPEAEPEPHYFSWSLHRVRLPGDAGWGILNPAWETTARVRTQEALRESEAIYRAIGESIDYGIWICDAQGRNTYASESFLKLVGMTQEQCAEFGWGNVLHPEDAEATIAAWKECVQGGGPWYRKHRYRGADGEWHPILACGVPIRDGSGTIIRWAGINLDISELKKVEDALRESEERFRSLADGTPVLIWVHDAEGGLRFVNRAWVEFFGKTLEQAIGENWKPLVHAEDHLGYVDKFLRCHAERREFHAQARVQRWDGQWRWIESFGAPRFSGTGEYLGMAGSTVDITARKEAEAVLARDKENLERLVAERTAALRELVGELEHFSYSITHDMRAPLRAMMGFAEVAKELCSGCERQEQKLFLDRIQTAARRMDLLITDALNYSKAVRSELPLAPVDLGRLLRGMLDTYPELQVAPGGIRIERELPLVMGNEAGLTQCFSNLLGNAVKFAKPEQAPEVRVWGEEVQSGWVRIWVADRGIGIGAKMVPRVFDMFARGRSEQAGTGIGLALVRKVVQRMGGRVGVESGEGEGSRFWVELKSGDVMGRSRGPGDL